MNQKLVQVLAVGLVLAKSERIAFDGVGSISGAVAPAHWSNTNKIGGLAVFVAQSITFGKIGRADGTVARSASVRFLRDGLAWTAASASFQMVAFGAVAQAAFGRVETADVVPGALEVDVCWVGTDSSKIDEALRAVFKAEVAHT